MPEKMTIYHNPRCSKSRQTLALLQEKGVEPDVVLYLQDTPDVDTLESLTQKLDIEPRMLLRKGEEAYKQLGLADTSLPNETLLEAMAANPKLIERPIVVKGNKAVLGRPPENVLEIL